MGATSGGVARGGVLEIAGVSEGTVLLKEGCEASDEEVTAVAEGSSIEGSNRVGTEEGSGGGMLSGVIIMLSSVEGCFGSSAVEVRESFAVPSSGIASSVSVLSESSLESANVEGEEGVAGVDEGVVEGDEGVADGAGVVTADDDVGGTDVDGVDNVGDGEGDDDVDGCESCVVEVDKNETDDVGVALDGGGGGGVNVVEGVMMGELSTAVTSSGEVVTTSGGGSEVVSGGRRSIGMGMPVAKGLGTTGVTREASEGGSGARNGGRVLATN